MLHLPWGRSLPWPQGLARSVCISNAELGKQNSQNQVYNNDNAEGKIVQHPSPDLFEMADGIFLMYKPTSRWN